MKKHNKPEPIHCEIRDEWGFVESATIVYTTAEAHAWYKEHGIKKGLGDAMYERTGWTYKKDEVLE